MSERIRGESAEYKKKCHIQTCKSPPPPSPPPHTYPSGGVHVRYGPVSSFGFAMFLNRHPHIPRPVSIYRVAGYAVQDEHTLCCFWTEDVEWGCTTDLFVVCVDVRVDVCVNVCSFVYTDMCVDVCVDIPLRHPTIKPVVILSLTFISPPLSGNSTYSGAMPVFCRRYIS